MGIGGEAEFNIMRVMTEGIRGVLDADAGLIDMHHRGELPIEKPVIEFPFTDVETATQTAGWSIGWPR